MAEEVGFEPTCPGFCRGKSISSRPRYDHFGTPPRMGTIQRPTARKREAEYSKPRSGRPPQSWPWPDAVSGRAREVNPCGG